MEFTYEGITSVIVEAQSHRRLPCEARDSVQNVTAGRLREGRVKVVKVKKG